MYQPKHRVYKILSYTPFYTFLKKMYDTPAIPKKRCIKMHR